MFSPDTDNPYFDMAADFVQHTARHIFLTGKAGTGKTTFLKYIREHCNKHTVVVAPTGVAAINAGGMTMHSFFQLPFGPYIPGPQGAFTGMESTDKHSLLKKIRFNSEKRKLLEEMELLIIDEVSMVRCDMLDAMDAILRYFRRRQDLPFGGVQVLYIGDLFQLPPVVPNEEGRLLQQYYPHPFFFNAKVVAEAPPLYLELKKIYRQNEQHFIDLLNQVRNNNISDDALRQLNDLYQPDFEPPAGEKYITLCTHNHSADALNRTKLEALTGKAMTFNGVIDGDFSDKALPTDMELQLKEGAQVMFIKNDPGYEKRYYNGKLAVVSKIEQDAIWVIPDGEEEALEATKETWRNIRYSFNKESNQVEEEELGSFTQYPLRLAWAITIHKSQGLTFEKAIIDAGASFAAGQVYVALSRCTTLGGLALGSRLYRSAIQTDERVIAFVNREAAQSELENLLQKEKKVFLAAGLLKTFDYHKLIQALESWQQGIAGSKLADPEETLQLAGQLLQAARQQSAVAERFRRQLQQLLEEENTEALQERGEKAVHYFYDHIHGQLIEPLRIHIQQLQYQSKIKKYLQLVAETEAAVCQQLEKILIAGHNETPFLQVAEQQEKLAVLQQKPVVVKAKKEKGATQRETFQLFGEGKTIEEIATLRGLAASTIENHLAGFVRTGELALDKLVPADKILLINQVIDELGETGSAVIKEKLGEACSYSDIKAVLNARLFEAETTGG